MSDARDDLPQRWHHEEIERRFNNMMGVYRVLEVDAKKARIKVELSAEQSAGTGMSGSKGKTPSQWLPMAMLRAGKNNHFSIVEPGEQVMVFAPSGDLSQGVVWGSINSDDFKEVGDDVKDDVKRFEDGSVISYDKKNKQYKMSMNKDANLTTTVGDNVVNHNKSQVQVKTKNTTTTHVDDTITHKTAEALVTITKDLISHKTPQALVEIAKDAITKTVGSTKITQTLEKVLTEAGGGTVLAQAGKVLLNCF